MLYLKVHASIAAAHFSLYIYCWKTYIGWHIDFAVSVILLSHVSCLCLAVIDSEGLEETSIR